MRMEFISDEFVSSIMNEIKEQKQCAGDDMNLFKPALFELFRNVQQLTINAGGYGEEYAFNLERLSQYAFPKWLRSMSISGGWFKDAATDSVKEAFNSRGWRFELGYQGRE